MSRERPLNSVTASSSLLGVIGGATAVGGMAVGGMAVGATAGGAIGTMGGITAGLTGGTTGKSVRAIGPTDRITGSLDGGS